MVNGHGGLRAPESQFTQKGTRVAPQIFMDAQTRDVGLDRRNVAWSPKNILVDTVARMQQDLADIRAESRQLRTPGAHSSAGGFYDNQSATVWRDDQLGTVSASF